MNFYTTISNKSAIKLFVFSNIIFLTSTLFLMFQLDEYIAKKGYFILHKISKATHMKEYTKKYPTDVIFIGHSKAQNHISTAFFREQNISIYTYGVSAVSFSDYPYMIKKAIETNPKKIVLNIHPTWLYNGWRLPSMHQPTFIDLLEQIKATNLPAPPRNIFDIFPLKFYLDRYKSLLSRTSKNTKDKVENLISKYQYVPDCETFNYRGKERILTLCTNGNGTVWYNKPLKKIHTIKLTETNKATISLLNHMLDEIKKHKIEAYILLEAVNYNQKYDFDINKIYKNIHINKRYIIDSTHLQFNDEQWADDGHVNGNGKEKVSSFIIDKIK